MNDTLPLRNLQEIEKCGHSSTLMILRNVIYNERRMVMDYGYFGRSRTTILDEIWGGEGIRYEVQFCILLLELDDVVILVRAGR